jgi:hypothetical protein
LCVCVCESVCVCVCVCVCLLASVSAYVSAPVYVCGCTFLSTISSQTSSFQPNFHHRSFNHPRTVTAVRPPSYPILSQVKTHTAAAFAPDISHTHITAAKAIPTVLTSVYFPPTTSASTSHATVLSHNSQVEAAHEGVITSAERKKCRVDTDKWM